MTCALAGGKFEDDVYRGAAGAAGVTVVCSTAAEVTGLSTVVELVTTSRRRRCSRNDDTEGGRRRAFTFTFTAGIVTGTRVGDKKAAVVGNDKSAAARTNVVARDCKHEL
jgi:DNA gyrase/topoisomerase IV subunit B